MNLNSIKFDGEMSPEIYNEIAKETANFISFGTKNSTTQIRKFYEELAMWNERVQSVKASQNNDNKANAKNEKYKELAPFIKMLNAKVAYAKGRGNVDENFEQCFTHCINKINNAETLKRSKLFMEAVIGFKKAIEITKKQEDKKTYRQR